MRDLAVRVNHELEQRFFKWVIPRDFWLLVPAVVVFGFMTLQALWFGWVSVLPGVGLALLLFLVWVYLECSSRGGRVL